MSDRTATQNRGLRRAASGLALAAALLVAPACTGEDDVASAETVAKLTEELKLSQLENDAMAKRLERLERKMDGFSQDVDRLGREKIVEALDIQNTVAEAVAAEGGEGMAAASAPGGGIDLSVLKTEDGKAQLQEAMREIEEKRSSDRRQQWVGSMVDRLAEEGNYSTAQKEDMNRIVSGSFKKIGDLWRSMRDMGDMTTEERAALREENMMRMEEIRLETNDEVKAVLDADQYALYEEQANRMRGFGGRGGNRNRSR